MRAHSPQSPPQRHRAFSSPALLAPAHSHARLGMSLLEVILAIAVAGFVLAAAVSFLVSISSIWSERAARHFFEDHVDGVTEFLNASLASAGLEIALNQNTIDREPAASTDNTSDSTATDAKLTLFEQSNGSRSAHSKDSAGNNSGLVRAADEPIAWARPPGFARHQAPLLSFKLNEVPPLLIGLDNAPLLGVNAFLYLEQDTGLSLLWHSILQEQSEDINDLRRTTISTLVSAMHYVYWDERFEQWEETDEPQEGDGDDQYRLPRFIKLVFEHEGETKARTLTIPVPSRSALIF